MRNPTLCLSVILSLALPGMAGAEEIGVPAGCEVLATVVKPDCEAHHVMRCERLSANERHVDVFKDGVFKGEETRHTVLMTAWRRGKYRQVLEGDPARLDLVGPDLAVGDVVEVPYTRTRIVLPRKEGEEQVAKGTRRVEFLNLTEYGPDGDRRQAMRLKLNDSVEGEDPVETVLIYDPELGIVIATDKTLEKTTVLMPGDEGFAQAERPAGIRCGE